MIAGNLLPIIFFLMLMLAGLMLAGWAAHLQAVQYETLSHLSALHHRCQSAQELGRALQRMDADPEVLSAIYGSLVEDLKRMKALDPARSDINKHILEAEAAMRGRKTSASNGSPALATEKDLMLAQAQVRKAMQMLDDLHRRDKISASQLENNKNKLHLLGIRVSVNSCFLMAQQAIEREEPNRAMSFFERAEILLNVRGLPEQEKQEKLAYIDGERTRVLEFSQSGDRLLTLAGGH